ncbi:MAG: pilus assembly protein [Hyphomonadaceae bacterium]|nr:pilus assembly protein [Hyphomonadaceae bacterium]
MKPTIFKRLRARHQRGQSGATAVEFALIATPFLAMMFALIEIMMIFFVQTTLEAAVAEEARRIRTGQVQTAAESKADFKAAICDRMFGLADCDTRLFVMVQAFNSAPAGGAAQPWQDGTLTPGSNDDEPYEDSTPGQMVIVRSYYVWPLLTPGLSMLQSASNFSSPDLGDTNRMLVASAAFRNEPFQ